MHEMLMNRLRRGGRLASLLVLLAFVLPILSGLAQPVPASRAEAALISDLAANICSPTGKAGGKSVPVGHQPCCILCVTGAAPIDGARLTGIIDARPAGVIHALAFAPHDARPVRRLLFASAISLRGPPVL